MVMREPGLSLAITQKSQEMPTAVQKASQEQMNMRAYRQCSSKTKNTDPREVCVMLRPQLKILGVLGLEKELS